MTPEDLVEIERIRQLKARYFRLLDQKKWDEWAQVFCEDVTIDTTQDGAPVLNGRAAFREFLPPILQNVKTVHHGHTSEIERIGPDTARGVWAMEDMLWWPEADGGRHRLGDGLVRGGVPQGSRRRVAYSEARSAPGSSRDGRPADLPTAGRLSGIGRDVR